MGGKGAVPARPTGVSLRVCAFLFLFMLSLAPPARAQARRSVEIFLGGGYLSTSSTLPTQPVTGGPDQVTATLEQGDSYALGITFGASSLLAVETLFGVYTSAYDLHLYGWDQYGIEWGEQTGVESDRTGTAYLQLNVVVNLIKGPVSPYATAGVGLVAISGEDMNQFFSRSLNAGLGLKLLFNDRFGLRIDGRVARTSNEGVLDAGWPDFEGGTTNPWCSAGYSDVVLHKHVQVGLIARF